MIPDMLKVLRINTFIQQEKGTVLLEGKAVIAVDLGNSAYLDDKDVTEIALTGEQLDTLFKRTFGQVRAMLKAQRDGRDTDDSASQAV